MISEELSVDSMTNECQLFLKNRSRNLPLSSLPLVFKIDNKINFKIIDSDKKPFDVKETFIESFQDIYTDKSCKELF